jgi:hypothetical protein
MAFSRSEPEMKPDPETGHLHSALAITSLVFGALATPVWLALPYIEKKMSWGEPLGSAFVFIPALILAALGSILSLTLGIGSLLVGLSRRPKKRQVCAVVGILLSLTLPFILWIYAIIS